MRHHRYTRLVADLQRFKEAQASRQGGFDQALAELQAGKKAGHWIWYVFPQLAGLGHSPQAAFYGIADVDEAIEYLRDSLLRRRLIAVASAVATHLGAGQQLSTVMASHVDALKLVSSLTLFGTLAQTLLAGPNSGEYKQLAAIVDEILGAASVQGYQRCEFTERELARSS